MSGIKSFIVDVCWFVYWGLVIAYLYRYLSSMTSFMVTCLLPYWIPLLDVLVYIIAGGIAIFLAYSFYELVELYQSIIGLRIIATEGSQEYEDLLRLREQRTAEAEAQRRREMAECDAWLNDHPERKHRL